jgi:hypothetical protein
MQYGMWHATLQCNNECAQMQYAMDACLGNATVRLHCRMDEHCAVCLSKTAAQN